MRRKIILLLTLLLISDDVFGKNGNRTKQIKPVHKNNSKIKQKVNNARVKRSLDDGTNKILVSDKDNVIDVSDESPFWGNRGRRDSDEVVSDVQLPTLNNLKQIKNLYKPLNSNDKIKDEVLPFWSNRGRRVADDPIDDDPTEDLFWANRGRRHDDDPFWGMRGRRQDDEPFWGNRGRRENLVRPYSSNKKKFDDDEPFWGNRGRRQEQEPFWGNRGRREKFQPFSGNDNQIGKSPYSYKDIMIEKNYLKNAIVNAINDLKYNKAYDINKRNDMRASFWINRGRESKLKSLFNGIARNRMQHKPNPPTFPDSELRSNGFQQNTVHDDRIYAEEPHYILVERSSRSSAEDDPFFISRGKKFSDYDFQETARGRRGALEEIVKSVRNDPYYIARGKKDYIKIGQANTTQSQFLKTKNLICASVDLLMTKHSEGNKVKREVIDSERDRRTILKKLAMELQMDPYFVSRGKKDGEENINLDDLEIFINKVIVLCN